MGGVDLTDFFPSLGIILAVSYHCVVGWSSFSRNLRVWVGLADRSV